MKKSLSTGNLTPARKMFTERPELPLFQGILKMKRLRKGGKGVGGGWGGGREVRTVLHHQKGHLMYQY